MDRRTFLLGTIGWVLLGRVDARSGRPTRGDLLDALNRRRTARSLRALEVDRLLARRSLAHAEKIAAAGKLFHSDLELPPGAAWCGEIIGTAYSIRSIVTAWMHSSDHRRIVLHRPATHAGCGLVRARGVWYFVVQIAVYPHLPRDA